MRGYHKSDVEHHRVGYGGTAYPTINVKVYSFPTVDMVVDRFGCEEKTAKQALEFAFQSACEAFWECVPELAEHYLGERVKVWQEGRQGGWLIIDGLHESSDWDGVMLNRWALFEHNVDKDVLWRTAWEQVEDAIDSNMWAEDHKAHEGMLEAAYQVMGGEEED